MRFHSRFDKMPAVLFAMSALLASAIALSGAGTARAEVVTDWITIGNAGNASDPVGKRPTNNGGSVDYDYRISKFEVTNAQYADFLNHKATIKFGGGGVDNLQLYNIGMSNDPNSPGIQRSGDGTAGNPWAYTPNPGTANFPVGYIDWVDAVRYVNWMNNGQGDSDLNSGAYTLPQGILNLGPPDSSPTFNLVRNPDAKIWLPNFDEWYKAAYYDPDKLGGAGYWKFATGSNTAPTRTLPDTGDGANYWAAGTKAPFHTTAVGAYANSPSPYGTFDQAGNDAEWIEMTPQYIGGGVFESVLLGGSGWSQVGAVQSSGSERHQYNDGAPFQGFRIAAAPAAVPEPSSLVLAAVGAAVGCLMIRGRVGNRPDRSSP